MGSRGHHQPYPRQPQPTMIDPEPFVPDLRSSHGPRFVDMGPPPEIMEQKLVFQHNEMQKLAHENHRLASSQVILRQDLASAQQELHRLQAQINLINGEKDQMMKGIQEKIAVLEAELQGLEPVKVELQQAHAEAQTLLSVRQELVSRVQQLTQQLQLSQVESKKIAPLLAELDSLRREYHNFRLTYDHERKFYNDHLDSLQVMEKNYVATLKEAEKLRNELVNVSSSDRRAGGQYGTNMGYQGADSHARNMPILPAPAQIPPVQNPRDDVYAALQGRSQNSGASYMSDYLRGSGPAQAGYKVPVSGSYSNLQAGSGILHGNYEAARASGYELGAGKPAAGYEGSAQSAAMFARKSGGGQGGTVPANPPASTAGDRDKTRAGGMGDK